MPEICYREFYQKENVFCKTLRVNFGQCDKNRNMHLSELLLLTSDAGVEDFELRGISWEILVEKKWAILVSRVSFSIERLPVKNEFITVRTWEEKNAGLQMTRRYEIIDTESEEVLVRGASLWILVDLENRRIIPAKMFNLRPEPVFSSKFEGIAPGKIAVPEKMTLIEKRKIHFSDIDSNGHVNNSKYGNFIMDCLSCDGGDRPLEQNCDGGDRPLKNIRINYSKEAVLGEEISVYKATGEDGRVFVVGKGSEENCFECEITYGD